MYGFQYNKDQERRDSLFNNNIRKGYYSNPQDYQSYYGLNVNTLKILLDEKFADPQERQNDSPTIQKFYDFMVEHPEFTAHGYLIGLKRSDYRVSIEGLEGKPSDSESYTDFILFNRLADEFDVNMEYCRSWWD